MSKVYLPSLPPGTPPQGAHRFSDTWIGNSISDYLELENQPGIVAKKATKFLKLYHLIRAMDHPTVVECGVDQGMPNIVMQAACKESSGHLYSIDIRDCSAVASSPVCTFIQSDDGDIEGILERAPVLKEGVDVMFIDSSHKASRVTLLISMWYKYIKTRGCLVVDDIDNTPYRPGRFDPNPHVAHEVAGLAKAVMEFYYANENNLLLEFHLGLTGLAIMRKLTPVDKEPNRPVPVPDWPTWTWPPPRVRESARLLAGAIGRSLAYRLRRQ